MSLNVFLWAPFQRGGLLGGSASEMASVRTLGSQGQLQSLACSDSSFSIHVNIVCPIFIKVRWVTIGRRHRPPY